MKRTKKTGAMKKRISLQNLITELSKFGIISFGEFNSEFNDDVFNCKYEVKAEFESQANITAVYQKQKDIREFCIIAAMYFDLGVSPIFDFYLKKTLNSNSHELSRKLVTWRNPLPRNRRSALRLLFQILR